jgi:protein-L-isoaspartate(D-aspartate) O-methyltransferase
VNYELSRKAMVEQQCRARGVRCERVLEAMLRVPRHEFVQGALKERAYDDYPLPVGEGQTISQPYMVALMTEALNLGGEEKVLEIGTGSGYQTAVLAELVNGVFSVERIELLAKQARALLDRLGYGHVLVKVGDGTLGWKEYSPFDRILVTAGSPDVPPSLFEQMKAGGKLVIPLGGTHSQMLTLVEKKNEKEVRHSLCGCTFVPLIGRQGWNSDW